MYCPNCSQQQIYDDMRFCSRCGFQLVVVRALLASDGVSFSKTSALDVTQSLRRKKDVILGAVLMLCFSLHSAWTTEDLSLEREYTSLIFKCFTLCVLINITPFIRNLFSGNTIQNNYSFSQIIARLSAKFKKRNQTFALPDSSATSSKDYFAGYPKTVEICRTPPSVTEETTNLLPNI